MTDAEIPRIAAAYPFKKLEVISPIAGTRNKNWLVQDNRGERYVLRRNLEHTGVDRIEFQLRFQQHLLEQGFPTPEIVDTLSGNLFVLDDEGIPWVLFRQVLGQEYDFENLEQLAEAARKMAQFHEVTESFTHNAPLLPYRPSLRDLWVGAEENLEELQKMFRGVPVEEELAYLRDWWELVLEEWPLRRFDALPTGWSYGDWHGRNMLFIGDRMVGLFDFDEVERGPKVFDVARGIHMFARKARGSLNIRPEAADRFLKEYGSLRFLSEEERAALPMMVAMYYPPNPGYYRHCRDQHGEDLEPRFRRTVATMRTLREEMARIGPL